MTWLLIAIAIAAFVWVMRDDSDDHETPEIG